MPKKFSGIRRGRRLPGRAWGLVGGVGDLELGCDPVHTTSLISTANGMRSRRDPGGFAGVLANIALVGARGHRGQP